MSHTLYQLDFRYGARYYGISRDPVYRFFYHKDNAITGAHSVLYNHWRSHGDPILSELSTYKTELEALKEEYSIIYHSENWCPNGLNDGAFYIMPHPEYGNLERLAGKFLQCSHCRHWLPQSLVQDQTCKYCKPQENQ